MSPFFLVIFYSSTCVFSVLYIHIIYILMTGLTETRKRILLRKMASETFELLWCISKDSGTYRIVTEGSTVSEYLQCFSTIYQASSSSEPCREVWTSWRLIQNNYGTWFIQADLLKLQMHIITFSYYIKKILPVPV